VVSAYTVFGSPDEDLRRGGCFADDKWEWQGSTVVHHLGFVIDTHNMTVSWPLPKRQFLRELIDDSWSRSPCLVTPRQLAVLVGIVRHASFLFPAGEFLSIRMQQVLSERLSRSGAGSTSRRWWHHARMRVPEDVLADIRLLRSSLVDLANDTCWSRPIALLVRQRTPLFGARSDASYGGIGGWSESLTFWWRLTADELHTFGFDMHQLRPDVAEPTHDSTGLHINLLEFLAIVINLWICLHCLKSLQEPVGGYTLELLADNTSALSWFHHAARSHSPAVHNLSLFARALLVDPQFPGPQTKITACHLKGTLNDEADALSRPIENPCLVSVIKRYSRLTTCRPFQVPSSLLSLLARLLSSKPIVAQSAARMTRTLGHGPRILPIGAEHTGYTGVFRRVHRGKRSRR